MDTKSLFNPDGSLKITGQQKKKIDNEEKRLKDSHCIKVRKDIVYDKSPKECRLDISVSDKITDISFLIKIFNSWNEQVETPARINQTDIKDFTIKIGSSFRRCSDCDNLINRYREHLDGNLILDKGTCPKKERKFDFEDHFS